MLKITTNHYFINDKKAEKIRNIRNNTSIKSVIVHNKSTKHSIDIYFKEDISIEEIFETGRYIEFILAL